MRIDLSGIEPDVTELFPGGDDSGGFKPVYSPAGDRIAFGSGAGSPNYDEVICVMNADGSDVSILVDTPGEQVAVRRDVNHEKRG